jgi:DNA-binding transcriptional ArsR family regulator
MRLTELERAAGLAAKLLKCLSNPQRLLILCHLEEGERSVAELERQFRLQQLGLSQQLARLRRDGLVRTRRNSRSIYYTLDSKQAGKVIGLLYKLYCREGPSAPARRARQSPNARPHVS